MVDYNKELGKDLTNTLKYLKTLDKGITVSDLESAKGISHRLAKDSLETLYNYGYIIDEVGTWKNEKLEPIFSTKAHWIIGARGINYLDLHNIWWKRFWVRSIVVPIVVSIITTVITLQLKCLL